MSDDFAIPYTWLHITVRVISFISEFSQQYHHTIFDKKKNGFENFLR